VTQAAARYARIPDDLPERHRLLFAAPDATVDGVLPAAWIPALIGALDLLLEIREQDGVPVLIGSLRSKYDCLLLSCECPPGTPEGVVSACERVCLDLEEITGGIAGTEKS
jgi:hypothetical protein